MSQERKGDWIVTFTGRKFWPLDPRPEDVDIIDIIHALSMVTRFAGHCTSFYSVAQHSVLVSMMCPAEDALWGLLHDASEAYLVDIPSPIKHSPEFAFYREAESRMMEVICDVFGLPHEEPASVKEVDKRMLMTEARDLTITEGRGWAARYDPYDFNIKPWTTEYAKQRFSSRLHELTVSRRRGA